MQGLEDSLTTATVRVSGIVPAPVAEAWAVVRSFGEVHRWFPDGGVCHSELLVRWAPCRACLDRAVSATRSFRESAPSSPPRGLAEGSVGHDVALVWQSVGGRGCAPATGGDLCVSVQPGHLEAQVGTLRRVGFARPDGGEFLYYVEQLEALDDDQYVM